MKKQVLKLSSPEAKHAAYGLIECWLAISKFDKEKIVHNVYYVCDLCKNQESTEELLKKKNRTIARIFEIRWNTVYYTLVSIKQHEQVCREFILQTELFSPDYTETFLRTCNYLRKYLKPIAKGVVTFQKTDKNKADVLMELLKLVRSLRKKLDQHKFAPKSVRAAVLEVIKDVKSRWFS